ncbi:hypothetical protein NP596_01580 [Methylomonas sp. WSC-6]|uniref:Uncharacterized protein n=1 Tax=Methylomonas rivi TaxID=2952226 RepID=A0ABT1TZZ9_9GAMM|nr:hypothetical protein [Methylomonas sp. WSC-6]MCQ8127132.1 hypothetical protein [Methylomonas sp. WSC-6]
MHQLRIDFERLPAPFGGNVELDFELCGQGNIDIGGKPQKQAVRAKIQNQAIETPRFARFEYSLQFCRVSNMSALFGFFAID